MRTPADLKALARRAGATLLSSSWDNGRLIGVFSVPDVTEGKPMATAILLEGLTDSDDLDPKDVALLASECGDPSSLHAWVKSRVSFRPESVETFAAPFVTLSDGAGDCDDSARALVTCARALGMRARYVYFLQGGQPAHVTAQLFESGGWQWAETTIDAYFGEHPFDAMTRLGLKRADIDGTPYVIVGDKPIPLTKKISMGSMMYQWTGDDVSAFISFCNSLGISDMSIPLRVWSSESNNDPSAHNPNGNASGIFQLMPSTAQGLGYDTSADPDLSQFASLSVSDQLQWALKFYAPHASYLNSVAAFYCVTFLPAVAPSVAQDSSTTVCGANGPYSWAYAANKVFDVGGKGFITGDDLASAASRNYGPRAQSIASQVQAAGGTIGNGGGGGGGFGGGFTGLTAAGLLVIAALVGAWAADPNYVRGLARI